ncbi:hypothetical protein [Phenylobacterium sp.]|uniref:hypothetical protein n=1 Tax=Phenylobacterium sp. TaxID=1871053 RepID=UPI00120B3717|nr:hypothetical protein [Phenylobacterium sp.]THD56157.1 MAG: hypothetical protein E8A12_15005 [Phenylobacterium sp.]
MHRPGPDLNAFDAWGYEIFDQDYAETGEVVIWSRSPLIPRIGELFNVETLGELNELSVRQIQTFTGGWTATCRTEDH